MTFAMLCLIFAAGCTREAAESPSAPVASSRVIAAGTFMSCQLAGQRVRCRGILNNCGDMRCEAYPLEAEILGASSEHVLSFPRAVTSVSVSETHGCALDDSGAVWCWGPDIFGERGGGSALPKEQPNQVVLPGAATAVAVGYQHSCAVLADGSVHCWGANQVGQLGDGTTVGGSSSRAVVGVAEAVGITASLRHTCAWDRAGSVYCWGDNRAGSVVPGATERVLVATRVDGVAATRVAVGYAHACALDGDGSVHCWGRNGVGQLGLPDVLDGVAPRRIELGGAVENLSVGGNRSCAVLVSDEVVCWGSNELAQLGDGTTEHRHVPVRVLGWQPDSLALGEAHSCATKGDEVWCWGWNAFGAITGITPRRDEYGDDLQPLDSALVKLPARAPW